MRKVVFVFCSMILLAGAAYAQGAAEDKMAAQISKLNKAGIDTIMVYGPNGGGVRVYQDNSPCYVYHNERYLAWVHKNHNYITRIDECYEYEVLEDKLKPVADLLAGRLSEIVKQNIRAPAYKVIRNGKEELGGWSTSDDMGFKLTFYYKGYPYVKSFESYYLRDQYGPGIDSTDRRLNIYYEQNQKSYIKQAYDLMNKILPTLKFKKK